jgi:hypothetical protein
VYLTPELFAFGAFHITYILMSSSLFPTETYARTRYILWDLFFMTLSSSILMIPGFYSLDDSFLVDLNVWLVYFGL